MSPGLSRLYQLQPDPYDNTQKAWVGPLFALLIRVNQSNCGLISFISRYEHVQFPVLCSHLSWNQKNFFLIFTILISGLFVSVSSRRSRMQSSWERRCVCFGWNQVFKGLETQTLLIDVCKKKKLRLVIFFLRNDSSELLQWPEIKYSWSSYKLERKLLESGMEKQK